jgi:hypothetical protein
MTQSRGIKITKRVIGDAAADGVFAGLLAGLLMIAFLAVAGLVAGETVTQALARFDPGGGGSAAAGGIGHLGVSAMYGVMFALAVELSGRLTGAGRKRIVILGITFGVALWALAEFVLLPASGSPLGALPWPRFLLAHLLYGSLLGMLVLRLRSV